MFIVFEYFNPLMARTFGHFWSLWLWAGSPDKLNCKTVFLTENVVFALGCFILLSKYVLRKYVYIG